MMDKEKKRKIEKKRKTRGKKGVVTY